MDDSNSHSSWASATFEETARFGSFVFTRMFSRKFEQFSPRTRNVPLFQIQRLFDALKQLVRKHLSGSSDVSEWTVANVA